MIFAFGNEDHVVGIKRYWGLSPCEAMLEHAMNVVIAEERKKAIKKMYVH